MTTSSTGFLPRLSRALRLTPLLLLTAAATMPLCLEAAEGLPKVQLKQTFTKVPLKRPLWLCEAPDGTGRLFVIEQDGQILILPKDRSSGNQTTFLDLSPRKPHADNEEGLLGLAFHPQFKSNGKFYVYYTQQGPRRSVVSEFQVSKTNPDQADLASERIILVIPQPYSNHNGGTVMFGPDGFFYIGLGDGGAANDPHKNGQNMNSLLGKILRIDVNKPSGELQYSIPQDNPFVGKSEVRPEIWASGMRNPWRMSFDQKTGLLYAADVGQDLWEEVDIITKGGNYGWNKREAFHPFPPNTSSEATQYIDPIIEYPHKPIPGQHSPGLSISGGFVYRSQKIPALNGVYLYADYVMGTVWGLRYEGGKVVASGILDKGGPQRPVAAFGQDLAGEVFVLTFTNEGGAIHELEAVK